jgi:hypothetical protein
MSSNLHFLRVYIDTKLPALQYTYIDVMKFRLLEVALDAALLSI